jgi:hypothetical protein
MANLKLDENKGEGEKKQRTGNLWNIVATIFNSDTVSVE